MSYNQKQLQVGTSIENKSTHDKRLAEKIAMSNLREDADHYNKLNAAGLSDQDEPESSDFGTGGQPRQLAPEDITESGEDIVVIATEKVPTSSAEGTQTKLTSSGLGILGRGTPKPLTSDKLETNNGNNFISIGKTPPKVPAKDVALGDLNGPKSEVTDEEGTRKPNSVRVEKTSAINGQQNSDPMDFFGSQISKALKDEIPRRMEKIPTNV